MRSKHIPDLRPDHDEITLEHCFVLIDHLSRTLAQIENADATQFDCSDSINPEILKDFYEEHFEPMAFSRLFMTPMGKGVLVGTFVKQLLDLSDLEHRRDNYND